MKNPQFLLKSYETLPKGPPHQYVQLTKFHKIWSKIVDFLLIANFEASLRFYWSVSRLFVHWPIKSKRMEISECFLQGTVIPGWIICAHHEIFNFVLRRAQRIWPYCGFIQRLKTSQGPNRAWNDSCYSPYCDYNYCCCISKKKQ